MKFFDLFNFEQIVSAFAINSDSECDGECDDVHSCSLIYDGRENDDDSQLLLGEDMSCILKDGLDPVSSCSNSSAIVDQSATSDLLQAPSRRVNKRSLDGDITPAASGSDDDDAANAYSPPAAPSSPALIESELNLREARKMQAQEMAELSLQEREKVYEDIHGVRQPVQETEAFRQMHLERLETQLTFGLYESKTSSRLPTAVKALRESYMMTALLAPRLTSDVTLRLAMLRATLWDVKEAACKMVKYFHAKEKLFGSERCLRPLTLADLDQEVRESLEAGSQIAHDSGGALGSRSIIINYTVRWKTQAPLSLAQASFYLSHVSIRSVRAQQRGLVCVIYAIGAGLSHFKVALSMMRMNALDAHPIRNAGLHVCFSDARVKPVLFFLLRAAPKEFRLRCRIHCGTELECNAQLQTFGIPSEVLPNGDVGVCDAAIAQKTVEKCLQYDQETTARFYEGKPENCVDIPPRPKDVLLGRGRSYQKSPGNIEFARLLKECKPRYDEPSMTKAEKTETTKRLIQTLRDSGVRFLKHDKSGDWWEEVSDTVARQRAAMSLRNMSRSQSKQTNGVDD